MYIGSYDTEDYTVSTGCIYRLTNDLKLETLIENLALPNGTGFSPDGKTFYVNEMMSSRILAFDFNKSSGTFSNKQTFINIPSDQRYPDGMTIDNKGNLWVALWQGFKVISINPSGEIVEEINLPVPSPTCMTFGEDEMKTLYITSAIKGLSEEQLVDYPNSGLLFRIKTQTKGLRANTFKG